MRFVAPTIKLFTIMLIYLLPNFIYYLSEGVQWHMTPPITSKRAAVRTFDDLGIIIRVQPTAASHRIGVRRATRRVSVDRGKKKCRVPFPSLVSIGNGAADESYILVYAFS